MTAYFNQSKLYQFHVVNLRSIQLALDNTALSLRRVIAEENSPAIESFTRLYAFLVGAWAETRLQKLINENGAFSETDKQKVISENTQLNQWIRAVELSFRSYYNLPNVKIDATTLPHTAFHRYSTVIKLIVNDLKSVIEVRNKLAHGQWVYPLNSECTNVEQEKYLLINGENLLSLQYKRALISVVAEMVHDLVVSLPTFDRDFDKHYKQIINTKNNLINRDYKEYKTNLVAKRQRGISLRRKNRVI